MGRPLEVNPHTVRDVTTLLALDPAATIVPCLEMASPKMPGTVVPVLT